jgi:hypothetical protein
MTTPSIHSGTLFSVAPGDDALVPRTDETASYSSEYYIMYDYVGSAEPREEK